MQVPAQVAGAGRLLRGPPESSSPVEPVPARKPLRPEVCVPPMPVQPPVTGIGRCVRAAAGGAPQTHDKHTIIANVPENIKMLTNSKQ